MRAGAVAVGGVLSIWDSVVTGGVVTMRGRVCLLKVANEASGGVDDPLEIQHDEFTKRRLVVPKQNALGVEEEKQRLQLLVYCHPF
jgi:hypothetical protein